MLRTCLDTDNSIKEFPTSTTTPAGATTNSNSYSADKVFDNGDIFGKAVYRQAAAAFTQQFPPEEIPGLPRHRPGEYSPTYESRG